MGIPQLFTAIVVLVIGMLAGTAVQNPSLFRSASNLKLPNIRVVKTILDGPTPFPTWKEQMATISAEEAATADGSFASDFERAMATYSGVIEPTPTPIYARWLTATATPSVPPVGPTGATGAVVTMPPTPTDTAMPTPTQTPTDTPAPTTTPLPTWTPYPTATPAPTDTPIPTPTSILSAVSPTPITGSGDVTPPSIAINGGPAEGSEVGPGNICFPLWIVDNLSWYSSVKTRISVDGGTWSGWANVYQYCTDFGSWGPHTVKIEGKDEAGNISPDVIRTFTVK